MQNASLQSLQLIQSVGENEPFAIVPVFPPHGSVMSPEEVMAGRVKWAEKAGYSVLTQNVPREFAPYNAVIRVHGSGTEDQNRDYLAQVALTP